MTFAILDIEILDVLVASIAFLGAISSNWIKISFFNSNISGTASITKSAPSTASVKSIQNSRFLLHSFFSCFVVFPFSIPLSQNLSIFSIPFSKLSGKASHNRVCQPF